MIVCVRHNLDDVFVSVEAASRRIVKHLRNISLRVSEEETVDAKQVAHLKSL